MKYLYFSDFHISGKNSRNRLGDYFKDCLIKFDEVIAIAQQNDCEDLIDGGDFFDTDKPSYNVLDEIADRLDKAKICMYSLFGNHSMSYAHLENSNNTGLAHLQKRSNYFKYLTQKKYLGNQFKTYDIQGIEYKYNIEEELKNKEIIFEDKKSWKILMLHALVTPTKFFDNVSYVTPEQIKTNADLVLLAHYHKPFKKEIGNTTFLNIGCIGRNNIDEAKIEPSVLLLDTEKRSYEIIKLKSAKKSNEIFDLTKYNELKENKKDIKEFIDSLRNIDLQSMDISQQIVKIGKEKKIEENVINYVLEKIENVK